jgi:hypothetical protein
LPGANPTTLSYHGSAVKFLQRNKQHSVFLEHKLFSLLVNSKVIGLAPGLGVPNYFSRVSRKRVSVGAKISYLEVAVGGARRNEGRFDKSKQNPRLVNTILRQGV